MNVLEAGLILKKRLLTGEFGASGERFLSVRQLASEVGCSYVTAVNTMQWLREQCLVGLFGNEHYITLGRCAIDTALEKRLSAFRRRCFGLILNNIDNHCFTMITEHLNNALNEHGYALMIMTNSSDMLLERKQLQMMIEAGVSGVFFFPHSKFNNKMIYENCPLPIVTLGRKLPNFSRSTVIVNNHLVGKIAAQHLISQNYKSFAFIGPKQNHSITDFRLNGFQDMLELFGMRQPAENLFQIDTEDIHNSIFSLSSKISALNKPLGIFCYHDLIAVELMKLCAFLGFSVPKDVGIIGCDNLPITSATAPRLSSINYPYKKIAQFAVSTMLEELNTGTCASLCLEATPQLVGRGSTGYPEEETLSIAPTLS